MKKILSLIAVSAIALLAISCQPKVKTVANTYQGKELTLDYAPHNTTTDQMMAMLQVLASQQISNLTLLLEEDGAAQITIDGGENVDKGTWTLKGDVVTVTIDEISLDGQVVGNTLVFTVSSDELGDIIITPDLPVKLDYLKATAVLEKK